MAMDFCDRRVQAAGLCTRLESGGQYKTGAHLERPLPAVDAMFGLAKRLVLEEG